MNAPIQNASSIPLNANSGTVPQMATALADWFQQLIFTKVSKSVVNFQVVEVTTDTAFMGVWQPYTAQQLQMRPQGQRNWKWFTVHAEIGLRLSPDEIVEYLGERFRVMDVLDYKLYGYMEYHLLQDYQDNVLTTEDGDRITTEDGDPITV